MEITPVKRSYKVLIIIIGTVLLVIAAIIALMFTLGAHFKKADDMGRTFYTNLYLLSDGYAKTPAEQYYILGMNSDTVYVYTRSGEETRFQASGETTEDADLYFANEDTLYDKAISFVLNEYTRAIKKLESGDRYEKYSSLFDCTVYSIEIWSKPNKDNDESPIYENITFLSSDSGRALIIPNGDNYYVLADGDMCKVDWTKYK